MKIEPGLCIKLENQKNEKEMNVDKDFGFHRVVVMEIKLRAGCRPARIVKINTPDFGSACLVKARFVDSESEIPHFCWA